MIKAASLLYAVIASLIIAILCSGLLLVFNFNLELDHYFSNQRDLINKNRAAISHIFIQEEGHQEETVVNKTINDATSNSTLSTKNWGGFEIYTITSFHKNDTVSQKILTGKKQTKNKPALYLRDNDETLKISGNTKISGDIYISRKGIEKVTISGNTVRNTSKHLGKTFLSEKIFPETKVPSFLYPEKYRLLTLEEIKNEKLINDFNNETIVLEVDDLLDNISLKGNIIIKSEDTLFIDRTAVLQDVIVSAPKIVYQSGFNGNTQSFANSEVVLEENTHLNYPSIVVISNHDDENSLIHIQKKAHLYGAIVLDGKGLSTENKKNIRIDSTAIVKGDVFCNGILSLYGEVHGSIFTSGLTHKSQSATYANLIFGGQIDAKKIPEDFFQLPLTKHFTDSKIIAIKQL